jgi:DNA segregation ATPase FtsK/SpoIIIE, S-DNA-T family
VSKPLGITETLEAIEALKAAARDFGTRAAKVSEELRVRLARAANRKKTSLEEIQSGLNAALAEEETKFQGALREVKTNYEKRKVRLGKAYRTSKERGLTKVEEQIGNRKYSLQRKVLQAERDRDAGLAKTTAELNEYREALAQEQNIWAQLEAGARHSFRSFSKWKHLLNTDPGATAAPAGDQGQTLEESRKAVQQAQADFEKFKSSFLLNSFRHPMLWIVLVACIAGAIPIAQQFGIQIPQKQATLLYIGAGLAVVAVMLLRVIAVNRANPLACSMAAALLKAGKLHALGAQQAETHYQNEVARIHDEFHSATVEADQELKKALAGGTDLRAHSRTAIDEKTFRITAKHEQLHKSKLQRLEEQHAETVDRLKAEAAANEQAQTGSAVGDEARFNQEFLTQSNAFEAEWRALAEPLLNKMNVSRVVADKLFPPWSSRVVEPWAPPALFESAAQLGHLTLDLEQAFQLPQKGQGTQSNSLLTVPLCLIYPEQGSVVFETGNIGRERAVASLNNLVMRLLSVSPPGRLNFTIFDPVGLGQNFAGIMHLADYEEQLINNRIWTQSSQIEQRLADLNEHMEKVIQMYLRNEYATIAEYNEQAGVIAEKYQFLVVADFPVNFSDVAVRRLLSIATSGARCGVYILLHWDQRQPLPQDFVPEEFRKSAVRIIAKGTDMLLASNPEAGKVELEMPPPPEDAIRFIQAVGQSSRDSSRVEVPFAHVTPEENKIWTEETTSELRVPIGRTGATKLQYLAIGKGTRQHGLIAGKTGSGKSTLFHVIITNLSLWSSPEQVEFYLVDFKKGVEFKCYGAQRLPHARVVAIESDREFGLSVLQKVDDELKRRGDLFRKLGVQDVAGYKRVGGNEPLPRSLLLIDEFQEFFVEDDKISQTASLLLDRIVRQGRAFGIHVLLGSQTLGGAYTVARTTLGQMVIRIALQCNEADAYLIMDDNNPAPRLLSRPGEGIYNDAAGMIEGNSPFQVVWLPDEERDAALRKVRRHADQNGKVYPGPFVFEGNAPADIGENLLLRDVLERDFAQPPAVARIWLGAPNSIKGPTEAVFQRQSGNNLLLIGQREEATLSIFSIALLSLAAQYPNGSARLILADATAPATPPRDFLESIFKAIPRSLTVAKPGDLPVLLKGLVDELKTRSENDPARDAAPVFLFIHGLQRFSKLRYEEDFGFSSSDSDAPPNPSALLNTLLTEGAALGFHVIASCDTYNNVNRFLNRKALSEFEMRVLFQMSANDSASLIDNPKASTLGLHRALYYNEQEGYLETFRPYALPSEEWVAEAGRKLERLAKQAVPAGESSSA